VARVGMDSDLDFKPQMDTDKPQMDTDNFYGAEDADKARRTFCLCVSAVICVHLCSYKQTSEPAIPIRLHPCHPCHPWQKKQMLLSDIKAVLNAKPLFSLCVFLCASVPPWLTLANPQ